MRDKSQPTLVPSPSENPYHAPYKVPDDLYTREVNGKIKFAGFPTPIKLVNSNNKDWFTYTYHLLAFLISLCYTFEKHIIDSQSIAQIVSYLLIFLIITLTSIIVTQIFPINIKNVSRVFGRIISFKITSVRNYPNWDSSFTTSFILFLPLFIIIPIYKALAAPVIAAFGLFLWNQMNRKSSIYNNCYNSYNKYLEKISTTKSNNNENEVLANSLAIDLLHYDLWAHKSFSEFFIYEILASLDCIIESGLDNKIPKSLKCSVDSKNTKTLNRHHLASQYNSNNFFPEEDIDYILNLSFQIRNNNLCKRQNNIWSVPE